MLKQTPLHLACSKGHLLLALELLKSGADPARRTSTGVVALHYLVSRQYTDDRDRQLLQELLPLLGDVNAQASPSLAPLMP